MSAEHTFRARATIGRAAGAICAGLVCLFIGSPAAFAQYLHSADFEPWDDPSAGRVSKEHYRLVKRFDFDERKLGNFEDVPMHWRKLTGAGLPAYSRGHFDDKLGAAAAPAFRFDLETGNIAYEYDSAELIVIPQSDYLVSARVRPDGLRHACAFVAAYLVDRFSDRIHGSERITRLVRATGAENEPWQSVELHLPGEFPDAYALRLQLWLLQDGAWKAPDPDAVDPIRRKDVRVGAWFDDLAVFRLPRARLEFSNPAGLVRPEESAHLVLNVNNATAQTLDAVVRIHDTDNREVHKSSIRIPSMDTAPRAVAGARAERSATHTDHASSSAESHAPFDPSALRVPVPPLPPGIYRVHLSVFSGEDSLLDRGLRFAVLPPLPGDTRPKSDLGLDLGPWRGGSIDGVVQALGELYCGHVKVGVPLAPDPPREDLTRHLNSIGSLIRELAKRRVETTGVLYSPANDEVGRRPTAIREIVEQPGGIATLNPTFAFFGGLLPGWQIGPEELELARLGRWSDDRIQEVVEQLRRFVTSPDLAVPVSALSSDPPTLGIRSVLIPTGLPARNFPRQLEPFIRAAARTWLQLQPLTPERGEDAARREERWAEIARRFALAKACGGEQLIVDAPFRRVSGDVGGFEPTEDFPVYRTMLRFLGGKRLTGTIQPAPEVIALMFASPAESVMVIWSWRIDDVDRPVSMYLGPSPQAYGLDGLPREIMQKDGRSVIRVGPSPQIVVNLRSPQALLQASFEVSPRNVQLHDPEPRPMLHFRNPYDARIVGEIQIQPPPNWEIAQPTVHFELEPGEALRQPLVFTLPPRQIAAEQPVAVKVHIRSPEDAVLEFSEMLMIGLHDVEVIVTPRWIGETLVVAHTIKNHSDARVRFSGFCSAPDRPRAEADFVDVPPGDSMTQSYVFTNAADLAGKQLHMGIQEIRGDRRLNQLVDVPSR